MFYVIRYQRLVGRAVDRAVVPVGAYLQWADVEAYEGRGHAQWTEDAREAKLFGSADDAVRFYRQQSKTRPTRQGDGRANRPLTAFSVVIEPVGDLGTGGR